VKKWNLESAQCELTMTKGRTGAINDLCFIDGLKGASPYPPPPCACMRVRSVRVRVRLVRVCVVFSPALTALTSGLRSGQREGEDAEEGRGQLGLPAHARPGHRLGPWLRQRVEHPQRHLLPGHQRCRTRIRTTAHAQHDTRRHDASLLVDARVCVQRRTRTRWCTAGRWASRERTW
jgi:hypothetical protein